MTSMYLLVTILWFSIGIQEPVYLVGNFHESIESCMSAGKEIKDWLTQDFLTVEIQCQPYTQEAYERRLREMRKQGT